MQASRVSEEPDGSCGTVTNGSQATVRSRPDPAPHLQARAGRGAERQAAPGGERAPARPAGPRLLQQDPRPQGCDTHLKTGGQDRPAHHRGGRGTGFGASEPQAGKGQ